MLHSEDLKKGEAYYLYEIRHDGNGNCIHVFITEGDAVIYPSFHSLICHQYFNDMDIERVYLDEEDLPKLYESEFYSYESLKKIVNQINSTKISEEK